MSKGDVVQKRFKLPSTNLTLNFDPKSIVDFLGSWVIHHYMCEVSSLQYQKEMELSHVKTTFPP